MEKKSKLPIGPVAGGVVVGAILTLAIGFQYLGFTTEETANEMASMAAKTASIEALVPFCLATAKADPDFEPKLESIKSARTWERDNVVTKAGWTILPGSEEPNNDIAKACAAALMAEQA